MNTNKAYLIINDMLDSYLKEGVSCNDLLSYLNKNEKNFLLIYNKCLRKINQEGLEIDDDSVKEAVKDLIRDRIAFFNDASKSI